MERECVYSGRCVALGLGAAHAGAALIALARHTRDESDVVSDAKGLTCVVHRHGY